MYYFRSNTLVYWFSESLSVPTYRATFDLRGLPDEPEDPGRGDEEEDEDDDDREELREEDQDGRGDQDRPGEAPAPSEPKEAPQKKGC